MKLSIECFLSAVVAVATVSAVVAVAAVSAVVAVAACFFVYCCCC